MFWFYLISYVYTVNTIILKAFALTTISMLRFAPNGLHNVVLGVVPF